MATRFEIECGGLRETITAATPHDAWLLFIKGKELPPGLQIRFREIPWNAKYSWDQGGGGRRRGNWRAVDLEWILGAEARSLSDEIPQGTCPVCRGSGLITTKADQIGALEQEGCGACGGEGRIAVPRGQVPN